MKIKIIVILIFVVGLFLANKFSWQGDDILILNMDGDKVEMVNVSAQRGMVNVYTVENMDVWIPNGMGWYPANRLRLIVKDDAKLASKVVFYNFGFWPNHVILDQKWNSNKNLLAMLGPVGWIKYRLMSDNWLWRNDSIDVGELAESMPRDLANSEVISNDIKINVVNATSKNGFGNMIADRLEWFGLMVTSVQTFEPQQKCQIYYDSAKQNKNINVAKTLADIFGCELINRGGLFEIVLGQDMEEVIKYSQTYVRAL